ncbi:von Willebrand factor D and EGF domain-containing protein-like [Babylonia areolata]|uniref:von Willebrand factor D and EGF domain-containing protein-like n=1 Tax=Babylonia areolata TaxID=304850 RepID=UPI003FD2287B
MVKLLCLAVILLLGSLLCIEGQNSEGGVEDEMKTRLTQLEDSQRSARTLLENLEQKRSFGGRCENGMYSMLNDSWRSASNDVGGNGPFQCDRYLWPGWYRFFLNGENAVIPTTCVEEYHCNTHAPLWLDLRGQSLPYPGDEVTARVCASFYFDCCLFSRPITVRNCGHFLVYKLQPIDGCHFAFCTEPQS